MTINELKQLWKKSHRDLLFTQATALAYTSLVSLVPVLAIAFFLFSAFGGLQTLLDRIRPLIEENLAPNFSQQIAQYIEKFVENIHAGAVGSIGLIGLILTSVSTLATIEKTFNLIWGIKHQRNFARRLTTYWSLLTIGPLILATSMALSSKALVWLKHDTGAISQALVVVFAIIPYFMSGLLFSSLFFFMPNTQIGKWDALKAGGVTGVVFELAKFVYASYAVHQINNNSVYGSLAIIPVFLLWLYVVWLIVLFGAELCCYFQYKRMRIPYRFDSEERLDPFLLADILEQIETEHKNPKGGLSAPTLMHFLRVPAPELMHHLDFLEEQGWVVTTAKMYADGKRYLLAVERSVVDMSKILAQLEQYRYIPQSSRTTTVYRKLKTLWTDWHLG